VSTVLARKIALFVDFRAQPPYLEAMPGALPQRLGAALAGLLLLGASGPGAPDVRGAVNAFVTRIAAADIRDLVIDQILDVYDAQGRHRQTRVDQRLFIKMPDLQRLEQTVEGVREIQIVAGDRAWSRRAEGKIGEMSLDRRRDTARLLLPLKRSGDELLADWRTLGVRDDVAHVATVTHRRITVIGASPGDRDSPSVWLDPQYGVVRLITRQKLPDGPALLDLSLSEYHALIGGVFFPYRQEAFVNGKLLLLITVRSVSVNTGLRGELFDPDALRRGR
jgi:hypothetical protein